MFQILGFWYKILQFICLSLKLILVQGKFPDQSESKMAAMEKF